MLITPLNGLAFGLALLALGYGLGTAADPAQRTNVRLGVLALLVGALSWFVPLASDLWLIPALAGLAIAGVAVWRTFRKRFRGSTPLD